MKISSDTHPDHVCFEVIFASGLCIIDKRDPTPIRVRAPRRVPHGDWKTQLVRKEFMGLEAGEEGILEERWYNYDGEWFSVRRADGQIVDCRARDLFVIKEK